MPVANGQQAAGVEYGQIELCSADKVPVVHVPPKDVWRSARHATHRRWRRNADHTPEWFQRNDDAGRIFRGFLFEVEPEHTILALREVFRQQSSIRNETLA